MYSNKGSVFRIYIYERLFKMKHLRAKWEKKKSISRCFFVFFELREPIISARSRFDYKTFDIGQLFSNWPFGVLVYRQEADWSKDYMTRKINKKDPLLPPLFFSFPNIRKAKEEEKAAKLDV